MSEITVYTFEDENGSPDTYTTQDYQEARERAQRYHMRLISNTYEWADSELIADYSSSSEEGDED